MHEGGTLPSCYAWHSLSPWWVLLGAQSYLSVFGSSRLHGLGMPSLTERMLRVIGI